MEHLTTETLARLVDDTPEGDTREHLEKCSSCAAELQALVDQTRALAALPELMPPRGDWSLLEARLRSEGLLRDHGLFARISLTRTPPWMRVAAAFLLFAVGAVSGAGWANRGVPPVGQVVALGEVSDVEAAAARVQAAEQSYVQAMGQYREILSRTGTDTDVSDPYSRYAALEHLVLVSQAAVRQAPGDPFLNGFLASALAERDAAARLVSTSSGGWF